MELSERLASTRAASGDETRDVFSEVKDRIHEAVIAEVGPQLYNADMDADALYRLVVADIRQRLAQERGLSLEDRNRLADEIADDTLGHGPIEKLLTDETVSEIMVNGHEDVWVERQGKLYHTTVKFTDDAQLRRIINKMVGQVGRRIDESSPMVDARLPDGSRVNAVLPPLSLTGPLVTIRKFAKERLTLDDIVRLGTLSPEAAEFLGALPGGRAQRHHLRRHRHRQDDAAQRALDGHLGVRADRHDRGRRGAAPQPAPRAAARVPPEQHRGRGRHPDPRARAQLAAHAPRPHHRRRGPRRRGAGHAPGDEHRPRRIADDGARELAARRAVAHRVDGAHGGLRLPDARRARADVLGARPDHPPRAHAGRLAQGHRASPRSSGWSRRSSRCRTCSSSRPAAQRRLRAARRRGLRPTFMPKFEQRKIALPALDAHRQPDADDAASTRGCRCGEQAPRRPRGRGRGAAPRPRRPPQRRRRARGSPRSATRSSRTGRSS